MNTQIPAEALSPVDIMGNHLRLAAQSNYDKHMFEIWTDAMNEYADSKLLAAQERIKQLENALYYIRESYNDQPNSIAFKTAKEALSPNQQTTTHDTNTKS